MSRTQKVKIVDPNGKEIWVPCGTCGKTTAHQALTQVDLSDSTPDGEIQWGSENFTVMCCGCKTVSFCQEASSSEDVGYSEDGECEYFTTQKVYPGRVSGRPLLGDYYRLPHGVANIYKQSHEAICNKQSILAGIGLRAIVEAVCEEKSASGPNLLKRIEDLVTKGVITQSGADILHTIRLLGNASAHKVQANTEEELTTALEVVEHLLSGVYLIPQKANKLKRN